MNKQTDERELKFICGVSGTGKSYFLKNTFLPQMNTGNKPILVFDKQGEYAGPGAKDVPRKWKNYRGAEEFGRYLESRNNVIENDIHVIQSWRPKDYLPIAYLMHHNEKLYRETGEIKPVSFVLDETQELFQDPEYKPVKKSLIKIARTGRKFKMGFVLLSQRTIDVVKDVRSQFRNNIISFNQTLQSDIDTLKRLGCQEPEKVLDLDRGEYKVFGELPKHITL